MKHIDLDSSNIMSAQEAAKIWDKNDTYVRTSLRQNPAKWPKGTIRLIGRQLVVTSEGMEAVTGQSDPRTVVNDHEVEDVVADICQLKQSGETFQLNELPSFKKLAIGRRISVGIYISKNIDKYERLFRKANADEFDINSNSSNKIDGKNYMNHDYFYKK